MNYLGLLKSNANFRNLFIGRSISLVGDWVNMLAIFSLLRELDNNSDAITGVVIICKLVPVFFAGPLAGVAADRFSRKNILIIANSFSMCITAAILLTPYVPFDLAWLFALIILQSIASAFFEPARTALIGNLVKPGNISIAMELGALSWSVMFATGSFLGGILTHYFGWRFAIIFDSGTFLVSTAFIVFVSYHRNTVKPGSRGFKEIMGINMFYEGVQYIRRDFKVAMTSFVKTAWMLGGCAAVLVMVMFGENKFSHIGSADLTTSYLYATRAVGTALGPVLARGLLRRLFNTYESLIGFGFVMGVTGYGLFSLSENFYLALLFIFVAHIGGSICWVYSTILLQHRVEDAFRGRVFATEIGFATMMIAVSTWLTGFVADKYHPALQVFPLAMAGLLFVSGCWWLLVFRRFDVKSKTK